MTVCSARVLQIVLMIMMTRWLTRWLDDCLVEWLNAEVQSHAATHTMYMYVVFAGKRRKKMITKKFSAHRNYAYVHTANYHSVVARRYLIHILAAFFAHSALHRRHIVVVDVLFTLSFSHATINLHFCNVFLSENRFHCSPDTNAILDALDESCVWCTRETFLMHFF